MENMPEHIFKNQGAHLNGHEAREPEKDNGISPRYILYTLMRHWYLFVILVIMGVGAAWL